MMPRHHPGMKRSLKEKQFDHEQFHDHVKELREQTGKLTKQVDSSIGNIWKTINQMLEAEQWYFKQARRWPKALAEVLGATTDTHEHYAWNGLIDQVKLLVHRREELAELLNVSPTTSWEVLFATVQILMAHREGADDALVEELGEMRTRLRELAARMGIAYTPKNWKQLLDEAFHVKHSAEWYKKECEKLDKHNEELLAKEK